MSDDQPLVSIIIPSLNSEQTIDRCLSSIKDQTYGNIETLLIDRRSIDRTVELAEKYGIRIFVVDVKERCDQLNVGVNESKGKYIYRVDSDFVLEPTVVEEAVKLCESGYDGVCIHNTSDDSVSFWAKVRKLERDCYRDDQMNVAARFFSRAVFLNVGGFDPDLVAGEDYDLHNRLVSSGYKIGRIAPVEVHLGEPRDLAEIIRKHYYYGKTLGAFINKNESGAYRQLSPLRPAFIRHWRDFAHHPILSVGFVIYQVTRYTSSLAGYLVVKMRPEKP